MKQSIERNKGNFCCLLLLALGSLLIVTNRQLDAQTAWLLIQSYSIQP